MKRSTNRRSAFTLLEVMLVLLIIGLLVGMVAPYMFGMKDKANVDAARGQVGLLYNACDFFRLGMNDYPASLQQLVENPGGSTKWVQCMEKLPKDPWGNDYIYEAQQGGAKPLIFSMGKDGQRGTPDDVYLEETQQ